jgi:hypothetical protein
MFYKEVLCLEISYKNPLIEKTIKMNVGFLHAEMMRQFLKMNDGMEFEKCKA